MTYLAYNALPLFLGNIRGTQILIIALVVLLLFGGKKIPELMRGLGKGVHSFKQGLEDAKSEINKPVNKTSADQAAGEKKPDSEPVKAKDTEE